MRNYIPVFVVTWIFRFFPGWVQGVTIWPFIFIRKAPRTVKGAQILLNHESIHWFQQLECMAVFGTMGFLFGPWWGVAGLLSFYIFYFASFVLIWMLVPGDTRGLYREIIFEQEAYRNQGNQYYLERRRWMEWLR